MWRGKERVGEERRGESRRRGAMGERMAEVMGEEVEKPVEVEVEE